MLNYIICNNIYIYIHTHTYIHIHTHTLSKWSIIQKIHAKTYKQNIILIHIKLQKFYIYLKWKCNIYWCTLGLKCFVLNCDSINLSRKHNGVLLSYSKKKLYWITLWNVMTLCWIWQVGVFYTYGMCHI